MSFDNINLWFAKNTKDETILAKDITEDIKHEEYRCPICGTTVIPKCGEIMSWHYAHRDASKCSGESMIHFWVKNELIKVGDKFKITIEGEITEYECKELKIEQKYETSKGVYNPDLTIITTTDKIIYIEIDNTNKKKIKDYIEMWKELGNVVAEVKVSDIVDGNKINCMTAIYYKNKEYYEQKIDLTEIANKEKVKYKFTKEQISRIDWLINDICKYNQGKLKIDVLSDEIQAIEDKDLRGLVVNIVRNKKCGTVLDDYIEYNKNKTIQLLYSVYPQLKKCKMFNKNVRLIYDRLYYGFDITIKYNQYYILNKEIKYNNIINDSYFLNKLKFIELNEFSISQYSKELELYDFSNNFYVFDTAMSLSETKGDCFNFIVNEIEKNKKQIIVDKIKKEYDFRGFVSNVGLINIEFDNNNYIEIPIEIKEKSCKYYIKEIFKIYNDKKEKAEKYKKLLYDYYLKCKNTKNNYDISIIDNKLNIYYKENIIEEINLYNIKNIDECLNNINLRNSVIENIKDYKYFKLINNVLDDINLRYGTQVNGNWSCKLKDDYIILYKNFSSRNKINIPNFNNYNDLFNKLIDVISEKIRNYIGDNGYED